MNQKNVLHRIDHANNESLPPITDVIGSIARLRILLELARDDEVNITKIIENAGVNHPRALWHLNQLAELNIVVEKRFGRIRVFQFKNHSEASEKIKGFLQSWIRDSDPSRENANE